jgi:hypothetical protein
MAQEWAENPYSFCFQGKEVFQTFFKIYFRLPYQMYGHDFCLLYTAAEWQGECCWYFSRQG